MPNSFHKKIKRFPFNHRFLKGPLVILMLLALFLPVLLNVMVQRQSLKQRAATVHQITIKDFTMNPRNITIQAGDTVTWTNMDNEAHDAAAADGSWRIPLLSSGESGTHTFLQPGTYEYWCTPHKSMMNGYTVTVLPAAAAGQPALTTPSDSQPAVSQAQPSITLTPSPSPIPSPTPTITPTPTQTPNAGSGTGPTSLSISLLLHGIGNAGDNTNPNGNDQSNKSPKRTERSVRVVLINATGQTVAEPIATVTYAPATGDYRGQVQLGTNFSAGTYTVKVQLENYLHKIIARNFVITGGIVNTVPPAQLIAGDLDGNNSLDSLDYNMLIECFNKDGNGSPCFSDEIEMLDLNDDGAINIMDTNLLLREYKLRIGD